jgi:hypothetical protein
MKKCFLAIVFLMIPALGMADEHNTSIVEMWQCELKEGKTMEEVEANNKKWLALARKNAGSDEVNSYALTTMVGDQTAFIFADSYPTLAAWSSAKSAGDSDEGSAIEAAFEELMDCTKNRLYKATKH